ncbi:MAG: metal ABC transporter ATP-binding protein [Bacillota bacterium]|nr:metal ABC transporter ATP-binding protein [Bacillota bacterium]
MGQERVAISLRGVVVSYREEVALRGVSLDVYEGEFLGVAGPNGAGKTTLLTVVNGLGRLVRGEAVVLGQRLAAGRRGRDFRADRRATALRRLIGYVPQGGAVDPRAPIRAREVVMLGRYGRLGLFRRPGPDDRRVVDELLELVGMTRLAHRPFGHLSGGEQQRVAVARALAQEPRVLLLDEPTVSLDWRSQREIMSLLVRVHRERRLTTLLVTHDPRATFDHCDRVALLHRGRLAALGPPAEALAEARLTAVYGGCCR